MTEQEVKIIIGGLLHDVGKVIYRAGDGRKHSIVGCDFLKEEANIQDAEILDSVKYHHADALREADISKNSNAYITYIADNIASAADRRKREAEDYGFEMTMPLQPVFNILKGNKQEQYYRPMMLTPDGEINYPSTEKKPFDAHFYQEVHQKLKEALNGIEWTEPYINSLLNVLETTLCYVPSSTAKGELADISLYDHVKLTAAINSCIYQYLQEQGADNYRELLYDSSNEFYEKKAFLLYSADVSGIQNFIYTIQSKNALKMLRARSFYLEFMMEHIIDVLLERLCLSRANLIYSGGGHCYMLLPDTKAVKKILDDHEKTVNAWLREHFDVSLYIASGYAEASANDLKNDPDGSYAELYRSVSSVISGKKAHRYSAEEIRSLNENKKEDYSRECTVCKRLERVNEDGLCTVCECLKHSSNAIMHEKFFAVIKEQEADGLPLPYGYCLIAESESKLKDRMKDSESLVRVYAKNGAYTGLKVSTNIWVGNYTSEDTFEELAQKANGIDRLGVLRADVDNLGQTFVNGFDKEYNTLSRTAALSRHLSMFFKCHINKLLESGSFAISGAGAKKRDAAIVYSGGDDLFIAGAWDDVIGLAVDVHNEFKKYTEGTLTLSGGIGVYKPKYPISRIAEEVGELEDISKKMPGKSAVTLLPDGTHEERSGDDLVTVSDGTYPWDVFMEQVIGEKYKCLEEFFGKSEERGKNFMYNLLELIRGGDEKINFARYVYLIARLEPNDKTADKHTHDEQKLLYKEFSKKMYDWIKNEADRRQLRTAISLYAYMLREKEGNEA